MRLSESVSLKKYIVKIKGLTENRKDRRQDGRGAVLIPTSPELRGFDDPEGLCGCHRLIPPKPSGEDGSVGLTSARLDAAKLAALEGSRHRTEKFLGALLLQIGHQFLCIRRIDRFLKRKIMGCSNLLDKDATGVSYKMYSLFGFFLIAFNCQIDE
jgi:hypothetical protein